MSLCAVNAHSSHVQKVHEFAAHATSVNCVGIGPASAQVIATGGDDKKVNVWRVGSASSIWSLGGNSSAVERVSFDPQENFLVSGSQGGSLKVFDLMEGRVMRALPGHRSNVTCLHYHPFGEFVVSGSLDTNVKLWDVRKKGCIMNYKGHETEITAVRFSPDGRWVASAAKNSTFKLWDLTSGRMLHSWALPKSVSMTALCFNPAELLLAATTTERLVRLFDMETFALVGTTAPESSLVRAVTFNSAGDTLLTATQDALRAWVWSDDVPGAPLRCTRTMDAPWDRVSELCATTEDQLVAASFQSSFVSVWAADLPSSAGGASVGAADTPPGPDAAGTVSASETSTTETLMASPPPRNAPRLPAHASGHSGGAPSEAEPKPGVGSAPTKSGGSGAPLRSSPFEAKRLRKAAAGDNGFIVQGRAAGMPSGNHNPARQPNSHLPPRASRAPEPTAAEAKAKDAADAATATPRGSKDDHAADPSRLAAPFADGTPPVLTRSGRWGRQQQDPAAPNELAVLRASFKELPPDRDEDRDELAEDGAAAAGGLDGEVATGATSSPDHARRRLPQDCAPLDASPQQLTVDDMQRLLPGAKYDDATPPSHAPPSPAEAYRATRSGGRFAFPDETTAAEEAKVHDAPPPALQLAQTAAPPGLDLDQLTDGGLTARDGSCTPQPGDAPPLGAAAGATQMWMTKPLHEGGTATPSTAQPSPPRTTAPREPHGHGGGSTHPAEHLKKAQPTPPADREADEVVGPSDDDVLASLLMQRTALTTTLSDRLTHLRLLAMYWSNGDVAATVTHLEQMVTLLAGPGQHGQSTIGSESALAITTDFLGRADLRNEGVTLDVCQRLLPLLNQMLASSLASPASPVGRPRQRPLRDAVTLSVGKPRRVVVAVRSALRLLRMYGRLLSDTLRSPPAFSDGAGVDLGREERYTKCDHVHQSLVSFNDAVTHIQDLLRHSPTGGEIDCGETFSPSQEGGAPLPEQLSEFRACFADYVNSRL